MNEEQKQQVIEPIPTPPQKPDAGTTLLIGVAGLMVGVVVGIFIGYLFIKYGMLEGVSGTTCATNLPQVPADVEVLPIESEATTTEVDALPIEPKSTSKEENPFCAEYGTFTVSKNDLLEKYTVGPGETLRDAARNALGDETMAIEFITANPQLRGYEIDDALPMGMKIYIPDERYTEEGITAYMKARGNIAFNDTKPMFGINAPNSGTGPFTISEQIKTELDGIREGDCVQGIYGTRGYDLQKVVFEVKLQ